MRERPPKHFWNVESRNHYRLPAPYELAEMGTRAESGPLPVYASTFLRTDYVEGFGLRPVSYPVLFVAIHGRAPDGRMFRLADRMGLN